MSDFWTEKQQEDIRDMRKNRLKISVGVIERVIKIKDSKKRIE